MAADRVEDLLPGVAVDSVPARERRVEPHRSGSATGDEQFDTLTRLIATATSRRTMLKTLLLGLVGALVGAHRFGAAPPVAAGKFCSLPECLEDAKTAHSNCLDAAKDGVCSPEEIGQPGMRQVCARHHLFCIGKWEATKAYCNESGGCGIPFVCVGGICCIGGAVNCGDDTCCRDECCGGRCVTTACRGDQIFDRNDCTCKCPPGTYLCPSGGGLMCFRVPCPAGKIPDPTTCQCVCPGCVGGKAPDPATCECKCPSLTCPQGQSQDPETCACRCMNTCPPGQTLNPATCACTCGGTSCTGACCNGVCVDLQTDRNNCGRCGNACPGGRICRNGACACPADKPDLCNGVCTNFRFDPFACGGCGTPFICPRQWICCPSRSMVGVCTDPKIDGENCGRCGNVCPGGKTCQAGLCACPPGTRDCNGQCKTTCEPDQPTTCPPGGSCNNFHSCNPDVRGCGCLTTTEGTGACVPNPLCTVPCRSRAVT